MRVDSVSSCCMFGTLRAFLNRVERRTGSFSRSVRLPCDMQRDKVEAELKDGVLTLMMTWAEQARAHKVPVKG